MATKKPVAGSGPVEVKTDTVGVGLGEVEGHAPSITQAPTPPQADQGEARKTLPQAPRQTSGNSVQAIGRIRDILQHAVYQRTYAQGIEQLEAVSTARAHPDVAAYKAEAIDYLRGKLPA